MKDQSCIDFLQWALPRLNMRWQGYRKVRKQVCKRIQKRMNELGVEDPEAYRDYLRKKQDEWQVLESFLPITISRFWRDKRVFELLQSRFLPELAAEVQNAGGSTVNMWSIGCGAGEEPYTFSILWQKHLQGLFPDLDVDILASDVEDHQLSRARAACYPGSALKDLPDHLKTAAFEKQNNSYCLRAEFRKSVRLEHRDIRNEFPDQRFHLIACRYLAFTYFAKDLQSRIARRLREALHPGGILVLGNREAPPEDVKGYARLHRQVPVYRREAEG